MAAAVDLVVTGSWPAYTEHDPSSAWHALLADVRRTADALLEYERLDSDAPPAPSSEDQEQEGVH